MVQIWAFTSSLAFSSEQDSPSYEAVHTPSSSEAGGYVMTLLSGLMLRAHLFKGVLGPPF